MKFTVERTINSFGSGKKQFGKLLVVSEHLESFIGKKVRINIEVVDNL